MTEADKSRTKGGAGGFMSGVFVLTASAIIVKIIGLVYKIPMLRILGVEGMGYFNCAYEIYAFFCIVATSGLPVAMSVIISSAEASGKNTARKIFRVSLVSFLALGVFGALLMAFFSPLLSQAVKSENAFYSILAISPTVLFVCISSAYRGYFQGRSKMLPTAISQMIEALGKLFLGLLFAVIALRSGFESETVAAYAALGLSLGMAVSALYLFLYKRFSDKRLPSLTTDDGAKDREIFSELVRIALPVTLSSSVMSLTRMVDMAMILRRLQSIGYSGAEANSVYGSYTTLALPLFSLAPALVSSIALPLVPTLSAAVSAKREEEQVSVLSLAISLVGIFAVPVSVGLCFFSREILELIFAGEREAIGISAPLLSALALSIPSACMITVTNAVLQAYGKVRTPIISMAVGSVIKMALAYLLIGNPEINIFGAPISTFFCDLCIVFINLCVIAKAAPKMPSLFKALVKPFVCSVLSVGGCRYAVMLVRNHLDGRVLTVAVIFTSVFAYLLLAYVTGTLDREILGRMPFVGGSKRAVGKNKKQRKVEK